MSDPQSTALYTVLHIEDNETNRYIVGRILRNAGYAVVEEVTGAAGLQAAIVNLPDLIVLDVKLPDMSGFEVCRQIKSHPETALIPVLHLSASFVKGEDKAQGLDSGADAYLTQPVEAIELLATVRSLLRIRQAEESALALAREWQTSFDAISDGLGLLDAEGCFLRCNQALSTLFNQPFSHILTFPHDQLLRRSLGVGDGACFQRAKASCHREIYEIQSYDRWFLKTIDPVLDDKGAFTGAVFILSDITDRKRVEAERQQAEAVLQERNQRLDLLYATTRDLLSSDQPLTLINSLFEHLKDPLELDIYLNYLVDDDRNQLHLASHAGISDSVAAAIEWLEYGQVLDGTAAKPWGQIVCADIQQSQDAEVELTQAMGITAYACQPLIAQGHLLGTLSFGSRRRSQFTLAEMTLMQSLCDQMAIALDRSRLLASLQQQTDELRRVNQIKDEFLAVLSHELRSPLNPILGWARLLRTRRFDAQSTDRALETIERNAKLQTQLIEDLLDISRILRGKMALNVGPVDLRATIEAAIETVQLAAEAKSIEIHFGVEPALTDSSPDQVTRSAAILVAGNSTRLQQIIWNLLSNAVKFTPQDGRVKIRLEQVGSEESGIGNREMSDLSLPPSPTFAQITISDTGKGISPEFLPHVFEYFRQEDSKTTRKFGGLGLGLAIVRYLTELHGGTVWAESPGEGKGATFTVKLPLWRSGFAENNQGDRPATLPAAHLPLTRLHILVVDDEADMRNLMRTILEQAGATVQLAASALEALASFIAFKPDVLISDIGMPDVDGYMLMQQIQAIPLQPGQRIATIALTAYAGELNRQQALAAGFQQHIAKPIEPDQVVRVIGKLVAEQKEG